EWAEDAERRRKTEVPEEIVFQTKPEIALDQICAAVAAGVERGVVLVDAAYGIHTEFREGVRHPPQSGWLDRLGRRKGVRGVGLDGARCASYFRLQNCPLPSAASCSRMYWRTCSSSNPTVDTA